jgi:putative PIN family toxin of toxin-antitoxin system
VRGGRHLRAGGHLRAVIDTNVIVSGLINPSGPPGQVMAQWSAGAFEAITCGALLSEVVDVISRPHMAQRVHGAHRDALIHAIVNRSRFVPDVPATPAVDADPDDDYLIALARHWHAALVTGDRHLLDLPRMPAIMRPQAFLGLLDAVA